MENTELTPPVEKTPEDIQAEMAQTRESLTVKVAALENQVVGSVQTAADTLSGTVQAMKSFVTTAPGKVTETVKHAAEAVGEQMKQVFDITGHVRAHPWTAVGTSALLGCVTGWLLSGGRDTRPQAVAASTFAPPAVAPSAPGVFDEMFSMLGRKVREIAENVIDTATTSVNNTVREEVPKLVDSAAQHLSPARG